MSLDEDLTTFRQLSDDLLTGVVAALPGWVDRCVRRRLAEAGRPVDHELAVAIESAGAAAVAEVEPVLRAVLATDPDAQRANPLAVIRPAVVHPTAVLRAAGVAPIERDEQARAQFPDDDYDLVPMAFAELDPTLGDVGIAWGAAKAYVHLARRRSDPPT